MRLVVFYFIVFIIIAGCNTESGNKEGTYIKIITLHKADSLTAFNKGIGLMQYFQFFPATDSLLFRDVEYPDFDTLGGRLRFKYQTFIGKITDPHYKDTLTNLLLLLQKRAIGDINIASIKDVMYCGPDYSIEIKDDNGERLYHFILDGNDTLENFSTFFEHFGERNWNQKKIENTFLNGDSIAVALLKKTGEYDSLPAPFLGKECPIEIDFSAIIGKWRSINTIHNVDSNYYFLLTMESNQICYFEQFKKGALSHSFIPGKFVINQSDTSFEVHVNGDKRKYLITKLTSDCFEYKDPHRNQVLKYSKVQ